jgi:hypothetical protein
MNKKNEILEEDFEAMLVDSIEDLYKTGLSYDEIFMIVKEQFGPTYANKFCLDYSKNK